MELFLHQVLAGLATGGIYACMALALVMIYQAIDHLNFAQGEMAMFSTFIAWQLMQWGVPYWVAFVITLAFSFVGGVADRARSCSSRCANAPILTNVVVLHRAVCDHQLVGRLDLGLTPIKQFPTPFGSTPLFGSQLISTARGRHDRRHRAAAARPAILFFRYTRIGLAMRAAAQS